MAIAQAMAMYGPWAHISEGSSSILSLVLSTAYGFSIIKGIVVESAPRRNLRDDQLEQVLETALILDQVKYVTSQAF